MVSGRRTYSSGTASARPLPPVSSKAKDYTDRPEEVVNELDELRTRGIAVGTSSQLHALFAVAVAPSTMRSVNLCENKRKAGSTRLVHDGVWLPL